MKIRDWLWERRSQKARRIRWKLKDKGIHVSGMVWKRKKWRLKGKWVWDIKEIEGYWCRKCLEYVKFNMKKFKQGGWSFSQKWCIRCKTMLYDRRLIRNEEEEFIRLMR